MNNTHEVSQAVAPECRIVYVDNDPAQYRLRSIEQITRFFDGLKLVEPGVVPVQRWRPDMFGIPAELDAFGGVGRKP